MLLLIVNAILFAKESKGKNQKYYVLTIYLITLSVIETICNYIGFFKPGNNLFLSHFYFNFQFLFLSFFFYQLFENPFLKKIIVFAFIAVYAFLIIQYYLKPEIFWGFNLPEILSISFILIAYSLIHLYNNLGEIKKYYYFCIGLIMYLLCSSIIFMSGNFELVFFQDPYIDIWIFNSLLYIVYQILILKEWKLLTSKSL
ncbi:hypothetical protein [Flavobacterium sp.]|uniref:hypothetical protein n=1 Tax=Flavobacterium sp. TaxID=239 RepID=UPI00286E644E|nr:hypothetical protein [Flavobacterium sp.]